MAAVEKTYELKEDAGAHILRGEDAFGNPIDKVMVGGDRVKSKKPLDKLFPNKWTCLDDEENKRKVAPAPYSEPVRPSRLNRTGSSELEDDEQPEVYDGSIDHNSEEDAEPPRASRLGMPKKLEKQKRLEAKKAKAAGKVVNDDSVSAPSVEIDDEDEAETETVGKEVTEAVPGASEKDLKVFLRDKMYHVFDADDLETSLSSQPLTKKALTKFIQDYKG